MPDYDFDDFFDEFPSDKPTVAEDFPKFVETQPTLPFVNPSDRVVDLPDLPKPEDETPSLPTLPGAREVIAATPMRLELPDPNAKGPWIQYNGPATVRIMTPQDWAAAGVVSNKYAEWNYLNSKRLPRSLFSDEELQYLLRVDDRFSLERE